MSEELTDEELMQASAEDWNYFTKCIEGLPTMAGKNGDGKDKFGEYIPYSSGPHILRHFRNAIEIVKPTCILEIGFNIGFSASMWLNLCDATLVSIDISKKDETFDAAASLYSRFPGRFSFQFRNEEIFKLDYSMCFIDGGHEEEDVTADIELCKQLKIPYLLFDDIFERFGPGVLPAISKFPELELVKDMNNLRLYKFNQ